MMTRRFALRDDQWERIKDLLPGQKWIVGMTALIQSILCRSGFVPLPSSHSVIHALVDALGNPVGFQPNPLRSL